MDAKVSRKGLWRKRENSALNEKRSYFNLFQAPGAVGSGDLLAEPRLFFSLNLLTGATGSSRLRPVRGPPGDLLPRLIVQLVQVFLDRELLAARRAAHGHGLSADLERYFLAACFALHKNLKYGEEIGAGIQEPGKKFTSGPYCTSCLLASDPCSTYSTMSSLIESSLS